MADGKLTEAHVNDRIGQVLEDKRWSFGGEWGSCVVVLVDVGADGVYGVASLAMDFGGWGKIEVAGLQRGVVVRARMGIFKRNHSQSSDLYNKFQNFSYVIWVFGDLNWGFVLEVLWSREGIHGAGKCRIRKEGERRLNMFSYKFCMF